MRKLLLVLALVGVVAGGPGFIEAPAEAHRQRDVKCLDPQPEDCHKVQHVIRNRWPDHLEDQAIECFADESGLHKWAKSDSKTYWGVAQMSPDARRKTNWAWKVKAQIRAALSWWRMNGGWGAWTAASC